MSTEAKILANRLNAQKSTGPQTPEGKAAVSQNALKHGLSARRDVIITESQAEFDIHSKALLAELAPQGPMESILADRIVSLSWRLKRAEQIQNQTIDAIDEKNRFDLMGPNSKINFLKKIGRPQPDASNADPALTLGRIALKDFANNRVLDRLLMYERRIEHSLYKTTQQLQKLKLLKNARPAPNAELTQIPKSQCSPPPACLAVVGTTTHSPTAKNLFTANPSPSAPACPWGVVNLPSVPMPLFLQNKPNVLNPKTSATPVTANNYNQKHPLPYPKKQTQNKPNSSRAIRNTNPTPTRPEALFLADRSDNLWQKRLSNADESGHSAIRPEYAI